MSIVLIQTLSTTMGLNAQRILAKHPTKIVTPRLSHKTIMLHDPMSRSSFIVQDSSGCRQKLNKDVEVIWRSTNSRLKKDSHDDYDSDSSNTSVHDDNENSSIVLKENNVWHKAHTCYDDVQKKFSLRSTCESRNSCFFMC